MLRRRRCGVCDLLSYVAIAITAAVVLLVSAAVFGSRTEIASLPSFVKGVLPAGRCLCQSSTHFVCDTCLGCAQDTPWINASAYEPEPWTFRYEQDGFNYGLSEEKCQAAFPGLFEDIHQAMRSRDGKGVSQDDLTSFELTKGMVRAMIYNRELRVLETQLVDSVNREKALATLHALNRALVSAPSDEPIPNIEFVFSVEDLPAQPEKPIWVLARRAQDTHLWLIPDFGFWSWNMPDIGTFSEVTDEAIESDSLQPWDKKVEKLVWRGKVTMAPKLRRALLDAAKGKDWSDVHQLRWSDPDFKQQFLGPVDQCQYRFIAHAEGRSYSGSLKYRQLCRSVIVSHKLQWIQHHHYLLRSSGPNQNYVEVERDFTDLDEAMEDLLQHPEKAKRIADNSVRTFRERYLTPAAEACYWRTLMQAWGEVSFKPEFYESRDGKQEKKKRRGVSFETFTLYDTQKQMEYPKSVM